MKVRFHHDDPEEDIRVVEAVRKAVGDRLEIMVDANQGLIMPGDTVPILGNKAGLSCFKETRRVG